MRGEGEGPQGRGGIINDFIVRVSPAIMDIVDLEIVESNLEVTVLNEE
jgi:hypothetical protein